LFRPFIAGRQPPGYALLRGWLSPNLAASQRTKFHSPREIENVERHRPYCTLLTALV
jgi:hypothetical protein